MWVFKSLSALLFLIGWMALVLASVGSWFYIFVKLTISLGWFVGVLCAVGSVLAVIRWENYIKAPFLLWLQLWRYADRMILDRSR